ncbi:PaaI family thioesterase [Agromyces sp. NPDC057865]|uniref:PaaI family thioesterase n=1 Tax=Agromyces sp. NPDC057865 TaxID=3346267 RepID=UPI003671A99A
MERESSDDARERTIRWSETGSGLAALPRMSGLDFLRAIRDGELPPAPISSPMLMQLEEVDDGRVAFSCEPDESLYNPIGSVHGGVMCTILDSALGCAAHSTLAAGSGYTSIEIKVNYLRPVQIAAGRLTAIGRVTKRGRRVIFAEGEVTDVQGSIVATASSSLLVFPLA